MIEIDGGNVMSDLDQKCLCVFVIDTYKLKDVNVINEISSGVKRILEDLESDAISRGQIEVAFISSDCLSDEICILQNPVPIYQAAIPPLKATTDDYSVPKALNLAMELVKMRETWYKTIGTPYYRSWIFLISNGKFGLSCNGFTISEIIKQDINNKRYSFLLTYTSDADVPLLRELESVIPITALDSLNIMNYFTWLESSIGDVCSSTPVNLTDDANWMDAFIKDVDSNGSISPNTLDIEDGICESGNFGDFCGTGMKISGSSDDLGEITFCGNGNAYDCGYSEYKYSSVVENGAQLGWEDCTNSPNSPNNTSPIHPHESIPLSNFIEERANLIAEEKIAISKLEQLQLEEERCRGHIEMLYRLKEKAEIEACCRGLGDQFRVAGCVLKRFKSVDKMQDLLYNRLSQLQNSSSFFSKLREDNELKLIKELLRLLELLETEHKEVLQDVKISVQEELQKAEQRLIHRIDESESFWEYCLLDYQRELHDVIERKRCVENELDRNHKEREMDDVYSSIFAPAEVKLKSHMTVQVYLHLLEETEKVKGLAREPDRNAERRDYIPLQCKLKNGDKVDVLLNIYGETLLMSDKKVVVWQGSFNKCSFDYYVPKDIDEEELSCVALLSVNGTPVGEMRFITKIVEHPRQLNPEIIAHKYNKVFVSYSHQDESKVKFLHKGLELGNVPHFFDREYLKEGDVFPKVIEDYINSADLFILCWSKNAAESDYVQKERRQALERAFPKVKPEKAAKLRLYPMSIEPRTELPDDMKDDYHFGTL